LPLAPLAVDDHQDSDARAFAGSFGGVPIAKLPFHPLSYVMMISRRGLKSTDPTDCSMVSTRFLMLMSWLIWRRTVRLSFMAYPLPWNRALTAHSRSVQAFFLLCSNMAVRGLVPKLFGSEQNRYLANMNPLFQLPKDDE
jgi:hypothetical protein